MDKDLIRQQRTFYVDLDVVILFVIYTSGVSDFVIFEIEISAFIGMKLYHFLKEKNLMVYIPYEIAISKVLFDHWDFLQIAGRKLKMI